MRIRGQCQTRLEFLFSIFHFPISIFEFASQSFIAARRIRRSAHMQMAQIVQRLPVLIIQSPREVWIVQSLIARPFRHVLQYTKLLLDHLLALPGNLSPSRQHLIFHIVALFWRHSPPRIFFRAQIRSLLCIQVVPLIKLLADAVLLLRRKILKCSATLQHAIALLRCQITHAIHKRAWRTNTNLLSRLEHGTRRVFVPPAIEAVRSHRRCRRRRPMRIIVWGSV